MKTLDEKVAERRAWRLAQAKLTPAPPARKSGRRPGRPAKSIFGTIATVARESLVQIRTPRVKMTEEELRESARRRQREYHKKLRDQGISSYSLMSQESKEKRYAKYRVKGGEGPKSRGAVRLDEMGAGIDDSPENALTDLVWQFGSIPIHGMGGLESLWVTLRECARIEEDYRGSDDIPLSAIERREATGWGRAFPVRTWTEVETTINELA